MAQNAEPSGFGVILRGLREAKELTQTQLADSAGMHRQAIAKLERGEREPQWPTVIALAKALGVTCEAFTGAAKAKAAKSAKKAGGRK